MSHSQRKKGPAFINWVFSRMVSNRLHEEFFGDLEEIYLDRLTNRGRLYAKFMYWVDATYLLIGFTCLKSSKTHNNSMGLYKHYLQIAGRNLFRNKVYALINQLSLAVGMGVCLVIYQYIRFEQRYDTFHGNADQIHRLKREDLNAGNSPGSILHPHALGPKIQEEVPEIEQMTRVRSHYNGLLIVTNPTKQKPFKETGLLHVDPAFLEIFDFPLSLGGKATALGNDRSVVISEAVASRHFGTENPLGKTLTMRGGAANGDFTVTGVLAPIPVTSHLQFEILFPIHEALIRSPYQNLNGWTARDFSVYAKLDKSADHIELSGKINSVIQKYSPKDEIPETSFQALTDIHLGPVYGGDPATGNGSKQDVRLFSIIAVFILIIAWINYINLSTGHAMQRSKEVGIRKSIGAFRKQLVSQFLVESFFINLLAAILAIGIAFITLPILNNIIGKTLALDVLKSSYFLIWALVIIILGSVLSGLYPAFILSGFKPLSMLKGSKNGQDWSLGLRKGLIIFQFLISLLLISGTYMVYNQITFMKQQELGTDMEKVVIIESHRTKQRWPDHRVSQETFKTELKKHASIAAVAGSGRVPGRGFNMRAGVRRLGETEEVSHFGNMIYADADFVETYGFEYLVQDSITSAAYEGRKVTVINEEAVNAYGFTSPADALNKKLVFARDTFVIKGVLKNFHWHSLREVHSPYLFLVRPGGRTYFSVKMNLTNIAETLAFMEQTHDAVFPDNPFGYFFLDEDFNRQYQADLQFGNLFGAFSALAIFIACIGLFALVSFSAAMRIKEIGIRKVLGASISQLMALLSRQYLLLLLIAIVLAIPLVLYFGRHWLENYAFQSTLGPDLILIPAIALLLISAVTVACRTYATARANPVKALRSE